MSSLVPTLLRGERAPWLPDLVHEARVVVLLVLDGLGWESLQAHAAQAPVLTAMTGGPITTVVPSTTAAALTSITTGLAPAAHGVVGFRMFVDGDVLNVLGWQVTKGRRAPDPFTIQRHQPFLGREVTVVTGAAYKGSGFTEAHLRDARFVGWRTTATLVEHLRLAARGDARFVYAYYPGIDEVAHAHGLESGFYPAEVGSADRLVGDVLAALPRDAALVVTSDHGQMQVGPDGWCSLGDVGALVARSSGDGRFRYLHARSGAARELVAAARAEFADRAWVLDREELLDGGWLGPEVAPATRRRVGDVVLAAKAGVAFVDPELPREANLISAHGSLTAAEMVVPCVAALGGAQGTA